MKFSIITAVYNGERYLENCIQSIMAQSYCDYEHIIIDGGSTDGTIEILKKYEYKYNLKWISEKDNGMYDAICKGFSMASGDIFSWLNYDDMYLPNALETVSYVIKEYNVSWCTGYPVVFSPRGLMYSMPKTIPVYFKCFMKRGYYGATAIGIQQESTFWKRELWEKAKGEQIRQYKMAGDYFLWKAFGKYETLYVLDAPIAGFRRHPGQKSGDIKKYQDEIGRFSIFDIIAGKIINQISYLAALREVHVIKTEKIVDKIEREKS